MCPLQSIPVTYTRDRCAYVVDLTLYTVESTTFTRQGSLVQSQSRPPFYPFNFNKLGGFLFFCRLSVLTNWQVNWQVKTVAKLSTGTTKEPLSSFEE